MPRVAVVVAGFAAVGATACAHRAEAEVTLVERIDGLLGARRSSGTFNNDERQAANRELEAMGARHILHILENPSVLAHPCTDMECNAPQHLKQQIHAQAILPCMRAGLTSW